MSNILLAVKLGKRIKTHRIEKSFSQETFAAKIGIHRTYIGSVERGQKNMTIATLEKISEALGISISELFQDL